MKNLKGVEIKDFVHTNKNKKNGAKAQTEEI